MTPTAKELMNSPAFWEKRLVEQLTYARMYERSMRKHTRPDKQAVLASAITIGARCLELSVTLKKE